MIDLTSLPETLPYCHVDAFADRPFTGNQATVMLLDSWPDDSVLLAIAEENNFAETAFLVPDTSDNADYELCWFTPTSEVELCGHATLASGHYILTKYPNMQTVRFSTRHAGILQVTRAASGAAGSYDMALPATFMQASNNPELLAAMGLADAQMFISVRGMKDIAIIMLPDADAVRAAKPDMMALRDISLMAIVTAPGDAASGTDIISRVFVPAWGVDEDSVTGGAHCALVPFWAERLGRESFTSYQASPRGGLVGCRSDGERVILSGSCVTVVKGVFHLHP